MKHHGSLRPGIKAFLGSHIWLPDRRATINQSPWTQQEPPSLWKSGQLLIAVTEKNKQGDGGWSTGSCLSPNIWTWAKSNNVKQNSAFFGFVFRATGCGDLWYFSGLNRNILTEQREDVSGSDPAQPAETGRKAHHPQRQRHRDVDPCLQYQKGSHTQLYQQ